MIKPTPPHIIQCHMRTHCDNFGRFTACNEVTVICDQYKGPCKQVSDYNEPTFVECVTCLFYSPYAQIVTCSIMHGEFPLNCPLNPTHPKYNSKQRGDTL
jgi:hypothetical protein